MENLVVIKNNQVVVSSRQVAEHFEKEHGKVLRSIEQIVDESGKPILACEMYCKSTYENRGKQYPEYLMNRDGFTLLAMGFTGAKALEWKLKYIEAFNTMEKQLASRNVLPDFTNPSIAARAWADQYEAKQIAEQEVARLAPKAAIAEAFIEKGHAIGFRELAKELRVKETELREFLISNRIAHRQKNKWKPYAEMVHKGYMIVKDVTNSCNGYCTAQALWTMEGKEYVRQLILSRGWI